MYIQTAPAKNPKARPHSFPRPLSAGGQNAKTNLAEVLPNPYPQKIVWQNRVHRIGTRIPSVSPLGETRPRPPPPYQKKKMEACQIKTECVVARRGRSDGAGTEECCRPRQRSEVDATA